MNEEIGEKVFQQVMDIWINPEIERRRKAGSIKEGTIISKMQIIFSLSGRNKVRLNDEVQVIVTCKEGEEIYDNNIEKIELTDNDCNCGHITLLLFKNNWIVSFDCRYNKEISQEHIKASKEFFESAKDNLAKNRLRPFFENAFASAELSAKSILLSLPDKNILEGKNHKERESKFESWAKIGNVRIDFSTTLSKLKSLRDSARYLHSEDFKNEDTSKIVLVLKEMIDFAESSIK